MGSPAGRTVQTSGRAFVEQLRGLFRNLQMYEANNTAVHRPLQRLLELQQDFMGWQGRPLRLQLVAGEWFVDGQLLRLEGASYEHGREVAEVLVALGYGEIGLGPGLAMGPLEVFADDVATWFRASTCRVDPQRYGALQLQPLKVGSVALHHFEPHELASWLYGSLLDLVERTREQQEAGETPDLHALKRMVPLVVDAMAEDDALFQLLVAVRNHRRPMTPVRTRVALALHALGFASWLDLPREELMAVGLAALLMDLAGVDDPVASVRRLFSQEDLGGIAVPVVLAVHDAVGVSRGETAGLRGQILCLALRYEELTGHHRGQPGVAASEALIELAMDSQGVEPKLIQLFSAWKGPTPVGSLVRLSTGEVARVVGWSERTRRDMGRPVVAPLGADGRLGRRIDLLWRTELRILGTPSPADVGLDLSKVRGPPED